MSTMPISTMPKDLVRSIEKAGYYPDLVADALAVAVAEEEVSAHLVHAETTFDTESVRRHLTVLAITPKRLVLVHADDHSPEMLAESGLGDLALADEVAAGTVDDARPHAVATTEAVPLSRICSVMVTHVVPDPAHYRRGSLGREVTLTVSWGAVSRVELGPATCGDPHCDADHGYSGSLTGDDLSLRIAADADGPQAVANAVAFARALSAATARAS